MMRKTTQDENYVRKNYAGYKTKQDENNYAG